MNGRFRRIQHLLTALPVLESAARLGSFTRAADELWLSQPTVSRHIMNLEADLGVQLFERRHNRLTLTAEGQHLASAVALGFGHIDTILRKIEARPVFDGLTIGCSSSFADCWLMPRFTKLRRALRDYPVHVVVSSWLEDLDLDAVDMFVTWRPQDPAVWTREALFTDVVYPVASPSFLTKQPQLAEATALREAPLLHYDQRDPEFLSWEKWFAHYNCQYIPPKGGYVYFSYQFMLQAAMEGEGIALGWHHLVAQYIADGRLVKLGGEYQERQTAYAIEYRKNNVPSEQLHIVLKWFREEVGEQIRIIPAMFPE